MGRDGDKEEEEEGRMKEVGCQSRMVETREAGVQVDLVTVSDALEDHRGLTRSPKTSQPAPSPSTRTKILVLDRGKGQKVFLVMNQKVTPTATERTQILHSLIQHEAPQSKATPMGRTGSDQTTSPSTQTETAHRAGSRSISPLKPGEKPNSQTAAQFQLPSILPTNSSQELRTTTQSPRLSRHLTTKNKILVMSIAGRKVLVGNWNPADASGSFCKSRPSPQQPANHRPPLTQYLCEFCGLCLASASLLRQHRWHIHGAPSVSVCGTCSGRLDHRSQMTEHSAAHNQNQPAPLPVTPARPHSP